MANNNWETKPLKKLCTRIGDGLHGTPEYTSDTDVFFINGNNLKDGKIVITKDTNRVTETELENNYIELNENTLLLSINGTLGSMAFYKNEKVMLGKSAAYLNFKYDINRFYYYYFQLQGVQDYFYNVATGSTIKNLSLKSIQDFEVPVPQENEWKGIANVLNSIDAKIELNNKINRELEAMAKTLYDYWFVQFDFPVDKNFSPLGKMSEGQRGYKSSGGKMVYNKELKREIPEGWEVKKIKDFADTGSGGTPLKSKKEFYSGGNIPWINSGEVNEPFIVSAQKYITDKGLNNSSAKIFKKGTILMAMYGATAGKVSFMDMEACTNQAICAINPKKDFYRTFTKFGLEDLYKYLVNLSSGSARDNLSQDKIRELKFIIPNDDLIAKYDKTISSSMKKILINMKQNQQLAELGDWLLPMLMNGQVTVDESSPLEPACR